MATTASVYNTSRTTRQVLKRHRKEGPSFVLHLHPTSFRIERQSGSFLYDSNLKQLLLFIRDQKVPADLVDVFDEARIPFFEACLIVEIHDHRPPEDSKTSPLTPAHLNRISSLSSSSHPQSALEAGAALSHENRTRSLGGNYGFFKRLGIDNRTRREGDGDGKMQGPNIYRVVLYPSAETLWTDLRSMSQNEASGSWSDDDMLQIESRILSLTSPPLCLTPDVQASRIANLMLSATALPASYSPLPTATLPYHRQANRKRGINSIEVELDKAKKKRREAIMRLMERGSASSAASSLIGASSRTPPYSRMAFIEKWRTDKANAARGLPTASSSAATKDETAEKSKDEPKSATSATKKKKKARKSDDKKEPSPPPQPVTPAKKKTKKQQQKEKEEREKAERERAEREAARKKEEEDAGKKKKSKKAKKKEEEAAAASAAKGSTQQKASQSKGASQSKNATPNANEKKGGGGGAADTLGKKPAKSKRKSDADSNKPASNSTPKQQPKSSASVSTPQSGGFQQQQQQQNNNGMQAANMGMFGQQSMAGFPLMQGQGMPQGAAGLGTFGNGNPFANMSNVGNATGNMNVPNMGSAAGMSHYQIAQQQLAIQRALQQSNMQMPQQAGGAGLGNMNQPGIPQHLQAMAAMQQQNKSGQPQQQQQQQGNADLPVGVGLGNLPLNWGNMG